MHMANEGNRKGWLVDSMSMQGIDPLLALSYEINCNAGGSEGLSGTENSIVFFNEVVNE